VDTAARAWADLLSAKMPAVRRVGYFGSYARGDWGVGSDLDLVVVVGESDLAFEERALRIDATSLPVPADVLVYTLVEWERLVRATSRWARTMMQELVWVWPGGAQPSPRSPA